MNRYSSFNFILFCLLICINYLHSQETVYPPDSQTCIFSGKCTYGANGPIPCAQNSAPALMTADGKDTLKELCPDLADGPVCCDAEQIVDMNSYISGLLSFDRCAPCLSNFIEIFCQSTCNPNQKKFLKILETAPSNPDINPNKTTAQLVAYSFNLDDANLLFQSCSKAYSATFASTFLKLMKSATNPTQLLTNIGNMSGFLDFQFFDHEKTFHLVGPDLKREEVPRTNQAVDIQLLNCNETTRTNDTCRCSQCEVLNCPNLPGVYEEPDSCVLFGIFSCSSFAIFIIYILLLIVSVVLFVRYMRRKIIRDEEKEDEMLENDAQDNIEGLGSRMEKMFASTFESWTRICVRYPYVVIGCGLLVVMLLSLGLLNFTVISDPVELWSSPDSVARQQREYYNNKFKPFFRVQQIIIKTTNSTKMANSDFTNLFDYEFMKSAFYLQNNITSLTASHENETITLNDVCYQPMANGKCVIQSPFTWFQEKLSQFNKKDYLASMKNCFSAYFSDQTCFGSYGGPAYPYVALGGFEKENYNDSTSIIISIMLNNHAEEKDNLKAMAWEKEFLNFMEKYIENLPENSTAQISYYSERSVGDELERQSLSDVGTIGISYAIMFFYVSMALGQFISSHKFLIDSKIGLAIVGVLIVLASVSSSVGFLSLCGVKATLIIVEVIPFLVLAVGVDNIFIIVQSLNRESLHDDSIEEKMAKVMSKVGPSLLLAFLSEVACFFLGAMSSMPCIRIFALNAALALVLDFLLQMTVFLAFLSLDAKRQKEARYDILVCIKSKKSNSTDDQNQSNSILYNFFNNIYAPFLMQDLVRFLVLVIFSLFFFVSLIVIKDVDVGLNQELSMPKDSYVNRYFGDQKSQLRVGPPMFFVLKNSLDFADLKNRDLIEDTSDQSMVSLIQVKSQQNGTYIATGVSSWIDSYGSWLANEECFQVSKNNSFCDAAARKKEDCSWNPDLFIKTDKRIKKIEPKHFYNYIDDFLNDVPTPFCPYGGHALFKDAVKVKKQNDKKQIEASYFMAYHSVLRSSQDFVNAFKDAKLTSEFIQTQINENSTNKIEVFPYSIIYVFYDQFLTMWRDAIISLTLSLLAIMIVTFVLIGFDLRNSLIVLFTLISILFNILNVMYWWDISLNAVSLVNLVMSIGISVEFCSHILHYYCTNNHSSSKLRAQNALAKMGSSVFSGIALTKFVGIVVLANSKSQIFQIFYFRMYLTIVLVASTHGLILLPVLLSLLGGKSKLQTHSTK